MSPGPLLLCHRTLRKLLAVLSTQLGPSTLGSETTDVMGCQFVPALDCLVGARAQPPISTVHLCFCLALPPLPPGSSLRKQVQPTWPATTGHSLQRPQIVKNWSPQLVCQGPEGELPPIAMCGDLVCCTVASGPYHFLWGLVGPAGY